MFDFGGYDIDMSIRESRKWLKLVRVWFQIFITFVAMLALFVGVTCWSVRMIVICLQ